MLASIYFLVIRVKIGGQAKSKPHPLCTHSAMASSFEVEAMVRGYHQYEVITSSSNYFPS